MGKLADLALSSAPQFKVLIPSKGITANMRSFLVKEQKLLLMAKEVEDNQLSAIVNSIKQMIKNCMLDDIDTDSLSSFDIEYMFVQLFMNSTATKFSTTYYQCKTPILDGDGNPVKDASGNETTCDEINKVKIDLSKAKITTSEIKTGIIEINSAKVDKIKLDYPTFEQLTEYEQAISEGDYGRAYLKYAECLKFIYMKDESQLVAGEDFSVEDAVEFLEYQSGAVFDQVVSYFTEIPKIASTTEFTCKKCGCNKILNLRGLEDFF